MSLAYPELSSGTFGDTAGLDTEREVAEAHLNARAAELREIGARVKTLVLMHPRPGRAILDAADEQQADSIALSTHGRAAVERMGLGSVADELIRHAKVSVLVHRPTRGEEPQSGDARASFASTGGGSAPA